MPGISNSTVPSWISQRVQCRRSLPPVRTISYGARRFLRRVSRQIFFRFRTAGADPDALELLENRSGAFRSFRIVNRGDGPCRIREAVVLSLPHTFPADTRIYGEGFNMLSQYRGTLEEIEATAYTDRDHYRLPVRGDILTLPPRSARVILVRG